MISPRESTRISNRRAIRKTGPNIGGIRIKYIPKDLEPSFQALQKRLDMTAKKIDITFPKRFLTPEEEQELLSQLNRESKEIKPPKTAKRHKRTSSMGDMISENTTFVSTSGRHFALPGARNMKKVLRERNQEYI